MTLRDLQEQIAGLLNSDDYLAGGGCMTFAEDSQTVVNDVATHLQQAGGIAAVVMTPSITPVGMTDSGLQAAVESLTIDLWRFRNLIASLLATLRRFRQRKAHRGTDYL